MDMELVSREIIKPYAPTHPHLKVHPLSFIDHVIPRNYLPVIFFYYPNQICNQASKILMLKKSLSKVLSRYYPFAGRFRDQLSIDCNDQGVLLLVTSIKCKLTLILHNPNESVLSPLFPEELQWNEMKGSSDESMLAIQINGFACGGIAISVCLSHKAGDAATLFNFINDWATINRDPSVTETELPSPVLNAGASMFSHGNLPVFPEAKFVNEGVVCKRFVFEGSKIDSLKAMVSSQNVNNPTRVEVATTLVYKCLISALGLSFKNTSFRVAVNLRRRMVPPLPENSVGNLIWWYVVFNPFMEGRETELHDLVSKMKQGLSEFCDTIPKIFGGKNKDLSFISECLRIASTDLSVGGFENQYFTFSSWCGFPTYEADFGWGKPIWVTVNGCPMRNTIALVDTRDGKGIEAYVSLKEKEMAKFESHAELLHYGSLNPTVRDDDSV